LCWGKECWGGGNKRCAQRDPQPSHIAAIVDTYGGMRVVVDHMRSFKNHLRHDEILVVVKGVLVHEPIGWGDIPGLIGRVQYEVDQWAEKRHNEPHAQEAATMYKLRCLEQDQESLDLYSLVET
jgi:hypothetical protein